MMLLVEKHIIRKSHKYFDACDKVCFESKNIYNSCLYIIRQQYQNDGSYPKNLYSDISKTDTWKNSSLGKKICNQTRILVEQNYKSFFKASKEYIKNPSKFNGRPKLPKYKDSVYGRVVATYERDAISKKEFNNNGKISLSKTNICFTTKVENYQSIRQVKVTPCGDHYIIFVIYDNGKEPNISTNIINVSSIDLGLNNLCTMTFSNKDVRPIIFNGRPLKSINQYYNKKKSKLQSKLKGERKTSKQIKKLTFKRNNKVNDYLHKISRFIVDQLVSNRVDCLVIGKNDGWKNSINIGKRNNQNFVQIPYDKLVNMLTYKAELHDIKIIVREESYTSKCSFLDLEPVKKHQNYVGKRVKRGLFKSSNGRKINADVNGSYNIMRKALPNIFIDGIEGFAVNPKKMSLTLS